MAKNEPYQKVVVEIYEEPRRGHPGKQGVRPIPGQGFDTNLDVECSRAMRYDHPVGTKLRICAKLTDREGGGQFLYSYHGWRYEVVG